MTTGTIAKIERLRLREVWRNEAADFTRWLQENIDLLNDVLDVTLANAEREQDAGTFSVDLVAEDESGNPVIIENQLERSDHDHLGKIITYLTALDAAAAIWIVADPRPEHVKAVTWLNEATAANFYLIKVEAVRIEGSSPAPLFTVIVGPSAEGRQVGETKKDLAERHLLRRRFWEQLLDRAKQRTPLHADISPSTGNWVSAGAGRGGLRYSYVVRKTDAQVELYIDRGEGCESENKAIFDSLFAQKAQVETSYGEALDWQRLEGRRACRIAKVVDSGGLVNEDRWPAIQDAMVDAMIKLEKAIKPHIERLHS